MNHFLASNLFKAIADPVRLRILHVLNVEEVTVGELVRILELPQSTISRHIKALKDEGLVSDRSVGPTTFYRANLEAQLPDGHGSLRQALHGMLDMDNLAKQDLEKIRRAVAVRSVPSENFFDHIGVRWDALREQCFGGAFHFEAFVSLLPPEWVVADLGTGTGYMLPMLARNFKLVYAVDASSTMLDIAKKRVTEPSDKKKVQFVESKLEHLAIPNNSVDLAVAVLMLHHLPQIEPAIQEVYRILKPGGKLMVVDFDAHENENFQTQMGDRLPGIAPDLLRALLSGSGLVPGELRLLDGNAAQESPGIGAVPQLYVLNGTKSFSGNTGFAAPDKKSHDGLSSRTKERKS